MISYLLFIGTLTAIYALLSLGLVVSWGQAGMVNLGLVGFFGLGAYCSALLTAAGAPIGLGWAAGTLLAAAIGVGSRRDGTNPKRTFSKPRIERTARTPMRTGLNARRS